MAQARKRKRASESSKTTTKQLAFFAALLVLIGSSIGLYLAYEDLIGESDVEVIV
ncbi:hypothetical protein MNQ98_17360 [Paenibacillus sp. N3/727]|uniref:hypothetical protein n=1 Tax=Paenibacillus sp. N3/727 TaxID=2925845 RepID=UPI001F538F32|nr:hypothetical protein [Paenibacillus sp. N3/727]UNK16288.1 hypothetical protein MNQ98_17360 [Paenibacillus sp. N3/727]